MAERDLVYMQVALRLAADAASQGEVPVGALVVSHEAAGDRVVATSGNSKESAFDPLGHAEIRVIRSAARELGRWRLSSCTLYVTLEPCVMCAGAIIHARLDRVVYGARDPKAGAVESLFAILSDARLNHRPETLGGVCAQECGAVLSKFFSERRAAKNR